MIVDRNRIPQRIFGYCKDRIKPLTSARYFYFYQPSDIDIEYGDYTRTARCLTGASYISPTDSLSEGFLSIIEGQIYEYYTDSTGSSPKSFCNRERKNKYVSK